MSVEEMVDAVRAEEPQEETKVKKTKSSSKLKATKKATGTQASAEEQKKGVPKDGFLILFQLVSRAEVKQFEEAKDQIGKAMIDGGKLAEGERPSIPRVVLHAMRSYKSKKAA